LASLERYHLTAHCSACRHHAVLDVGMLRGWIGDQVELPTLRARLRCTRCGHRGWSDDGLIEPCQFIVSPRNTGPGF
jgi:hypothetical protein